ncbi:DUF6685 family protein [Dankookia sp. P2]|uniref:DUF6685 family protein n=1 Tax=Dankookia sp. P2 TaxID=3423955 RepID=UPI003D66D353
MDSIISESERMIFPDRWLEKRLANFQVSAPGVDWSLLERLCPWREYQHLARCIRPRFELFDGDPFCRFGPLVDETSTPHRRAIDIRDMYGISASKSHIVPLDELSDLIDMHRMFEHRTVADCVMEVLHGSFDCVAREGEPVRVIKQQWDGRHYVCNIGGSHRFAALWRWHRENSCGLTMDCAVTTVTLSPATLAAVRDVQYWLLESTWKDVSRSQIFLDDVMCQASDRSWVPDRRNRRPGLAARGVHVWQHRDRREGLVMCVAVPRTHPMAGVIERWLEGTAAVDLSAAVMQISAGQSVAD